MLDLHAGPTLPAVDREPSSLRILLAEDNAVVRMATQYLLNRLGYRPDVVVNGREALEAVDRHEYDVVLMDLQMPVMDGLEAARRLRLARPAGGPRIIALTANSGAEDREQCLASGMQEFLAKPLRAGDLTAVLARCLDERIAPEVRRVVVVSGPS